ncbi:cell wall-active antibiotics response protein LiaF [Salipaludibacillus sp. LMS25]|jgi:lia operon protein LiaF|uniref:cell wall-active antibiotics response protein LiaF n=1 Tax=Salipaludibacillus sp. LMS25 TaxID=2924031 RepID=UPI0020D1777B|nr:cell wall-active antibiotics response protein LiaF [Salipaludibacillus sp. LMS25]UTR15365.1 cell wall-active antibiotics response protein LiaF [Salipaludibacillus sp. LMS25]
MKKFIGSIILMIGILFLLVNTGTIDASITNMLTTFWPVIVIVLGVKLLFEGIMYFFHGLKRDRWHIGKIIWGAVVVSGGGVLLGNQAGWFYYSVRDFWSWLWPVIIVYIGFKVLFDRDTYVEVSLDSDDMEQVKRQKKQKRKKMREEDSFPSSCTTTHRNQTDGKQRTKKNYRIFIGEMTLGRQPWEPDGVDVNMGIGSIELDLTKAILKEGDNVIDVTNWIGSVEVYVPKQMAVQAAAEVKLGEVTLFDDSHAGTGRQATYTSPGFYEAEKRLILNVNLSIGDVEVLTVD